MEGLKGGEAGPSCAPNGYNCNNEELEKRVREKPGLDGAYDEHEDESIDEEDEHHQIGISAFVPTPLLPLKQQLEKDKDDDSLRRWKEKLLGCVECNLNGEMDPEVKFHSIGIISDDIGVVTTPLPVEDGKSGRLLFSLREGAQYRRKLTFSVLHNIVSGLTYTNTVWKGGIQVDRSKGMLGTFAPQREPYVETLEEEETPSGMLARGIYTATLKFEDDDRRCYLELHYSFEIRKST